MYDGRHAHMMRNAKRVRSCVTSEGAARGGRSAGSLAVSRGAFDMNSSNCIKTLETLSAAGKIGGKIAGAKCRDEGIGWCGADEEQLREWKKRGGSVSGKMPYWNNGIKNKRAFECPGEGWVRGRMKTWS